MHITVTNEHLEFEMDGKNIAVPFMPSLLTDIEPLRAIPVAQWSDDYFELEWECFAEFWHDLESTLKRRYRTALTTEQVIELHMRVHEHFFPTSA